MSTDDPVICINMQSIPCVDSGRVKVGHQDNNWIWLDIQTRFKLQLRYGCVRLSYLLWRSLNNCMMLMCLGRRRRYFIFFLDSHFVTPAFLHRRVPLPVHDRLSTNSHSSCLKSSVCDPTISDRKHSRAKAHKGDCDLPYLIFFRPFFDCDKQFFFPVSVNFCGADRKKRTSGGVLP